MEYYTVTKKNEIMSFAATWMELEVIILNKLRQKQKIKYNMFPLISATQTMRTHGHTEGNNTRWGLSKCRRWEEGEDQKKKKNYWVLGLVPGDEMIYATNLCDRSLPM